MGMDDQHHTPVSLPPVKTPGTQYIGSWVGSRPVWTSAENLAPTRIRSQDVPVRSPVSSYGGGKYGNWYLESLSCFAKNSFTVASEEI
jgi:hypothetical protein